MWASLVRSRPIFRQRGSKRYPIAGMDHAVGPGSERGWGDKLSMGEDSTVV